MLLKLLIRGCQVGPTCQKKCDQMADPSGDFSLWNLLRVSHLEWAGGGGVFISLSLTLTFSCGIST
jgi:hypothetical protein